MKSKTLILISIVCCLATPLLSQSVYLNFHPIAGFPQGEYKKQVKDFGFGFDGSFLMPIGDSPFLAGIEANAIFYDNSPTNFDTPQGDISDEPIKGTILGLLVLRTQITNETFRPYLDTVIGFQHLFSESNSIQGPIYGIVEDGSTFDTTERDQTFLYGAGIGMMYKIREYAPKKSETYIKNLWLDFRARYLFGGETDFITDYSYTKDNHTVFNTVKGKTNLLTLQLGISLGF